MKHARPEETPEETPEEPEDDVLPLSKDMKRARPEEPEEDDPGKQWLEEQGAYPVPVAVGALLIMWAAVTTLSGGEIKNRVLDILMNAGNHVTSVGLVCAHLEKNTLLFAALARNGARMLFGHYWEFRDMLAHGTFVELVHALLDFTGVRPFALMDMDTSDLVRDASYLVRDAVFLGDPGLVGKLLHQGASPAFRLKTPHCEQPLWSVCLGTPHSNLVGTDNAVKMAKLLLQFGASPFLCDAQGSRLVDLLWCDVWWRPQQSEPELVPNFSMEDNRMHLTHILTESMANWSRDRHALFPPAFKERVLTMLCCNQHLRKSGAFYLSHDPLHLIFEWLAIAETYDAEEMPAGRVHSEAWFCQARLAGAELPAVLGRLVATWEGEGGEPQELSVDVPHMTVQPWIHFGRVVPNAAPRGGATLDMDLSSIPHSTRISRIHASLRYNVLDTRWEIMIHGRNGIDVNFGNGDVQVLPSADSDWMVLPPSLEFHMLSCGLQFRLDSFVKNQ